MASLQDIISDLNVTIADTETDMAMAATSSNINDYKRAIGQLKAARTSLIQAQRSATDVTSRKAS